MNFIITHNPREFTTASIKTKFLIDLMANFKTFYAKKKV